VAYCQKASGHASVVPEQAAQTIDTDNLSHWPIRVRRGRPRPVQREVAQILMKTMLVVIDQILGRDV
jgi:hypothetical protein